ncbi:predicted protein [Methanosarcina acetivorans C2A]|uniref:Uncharacterized protein n=1 Tax=Methanosarcina acetivorans (strain ATCC 35395 / DSM 2834 / JCM 12185 / C2A) TaxID=188937 RepID=Q8TM24_METAC|nr:predicted protein [Methanosarcina acetivorans C2A]
MCFAYYSGNILLWILLWTLLWTPDACKLWIYPSNILSIYFCRIVDILQLDFAFLCCSAAPSLNPITLSTSLNATSH